MIRNAPLKTGPLILLLLPLAVLYPSVADSGDDAMIPHASAMQNASRGKFSAPPSLLASVDQPDIRPIHKRIANEALSAIGTSCLPQLKSLYVRYDKPTSRGLAGRSSIILDGTVPNQEFRALLIHEFGHVIDLGCLTGTISSGTSAFRDGSDAIFKDDPSVGFYTISWLNDQSRRLDAESVDFVSGYAASDPFEDFAETFAYFVLQRNTFRVRAAENPILAKKYNWMRDHFEINLQASAQHQWNGVVPWDVTKLPYVWHKQFAMAGS